jgi:hypothetical protein
MDQNRPNTPGGDRMGSSGWSPSSQPGKAGGQQSITGTSDSRPEGGRLGSPGRSAEHKSAGTDDGRVLDQTGEEIRRGARELREQAVSQGREALGRVQERVEESVEHGKEQIADQIDSVGEALCDAAERIEQEQGTVGRYARLAGEQVCGLADYLRDADPADMARGVQRFARDRPELFLGGALITGLLIGRFLRSHEPEPDFDRGPRGRDDIDMFRHDEYRPEQGFGAGIGNAATGGAGTGLGSTGLGIGAGSGVGSHGSTGPSGFGGAGSGSVGSGPGKAGETNTFKPTGSSPKPGDTSPGGGSGAVI